MPTMNMNVWKIGVAVAFVCALADALGVYVAAESLVWAKVIAFAIIKGIGGAALYMKQHPVELLAVDENAERGTRNAEKPNPIIGPKGTLPMVLFLLLLAVACSGCVNVSKLTRELAKDNATVSSSVSTVYGTMKFIRANPTTNQTVTVTPDGTLTVGAK